MRFALTATSAPELLVLDASALLRVLLPGADPDLVARLGEDGDLHAPHLLDLEVISALRRLSRARKLTVDRATDALTDLSDLNLTRYPHELLLPRIWQLRDNLSAYDAAYIALAEALEAPLLTADARLAGSSGHGATIDLV